MNWLVKIDLYIPNHTCYVARSFINGCILTWSQPFQFTWTSHGIHRQLTNTKENSLHKHSLIILSLNVIHYIQCSISISFKTHRCQHRLLGSTPIQQRYKQAQQASRNYIWCFWKWKSKVNFQNAGGSWSQFSMTVEKNRFECLSFYTVLKAKSNSKVCNQTPKQAVTSVNQKTASS